MDILKGLKDIQWVKAGNFESLDDKILKGKSIGFWRCKIRMDPKNPHYHKYTFFDASECENLILLNCAHDFHFFHIRKEMFKNVKNIFIFGNCVTNISFEFPNSTFYLDPSIIAKWKQPTATGREMKNFQCLTVEMCEWAEQMDIQVFQN